MMQRWLTPVPGWRRFVATLIAAGALTGGTIAFRATQSSARQGSALTRGNKPGEWRYWGADAWS
ncbi:MAG: hypothetical protein ACREPM_06655, partial [Gemmatimonadaceae bacterium]